MGRWQQKDGVHQTIDPTGNWERKTDETIADIAKEIHQTASGDRSETIGGESTEEVTGPKKNHCSSLPCHCAHRRDRRPQWRAKFIAAYLKCIK